MWCRRQYRPERARAYIEEYEIIRTSTEACLKAQRSDKTKTYLAAGSDPLENRTRLPSQHDTFVLD